MSGAADFKTSVFNPLKISSAPHLSSPGFSRVFQGSADISLNKQNLCRKYWRFQCFDPKFNNKKAADVFKKTKSVPNKFVDPKILVLVPSKLWSLFQGPQWNKTIYLNNFNIFGAKLENCCVTSLTDCIWFFGSKLEKERKSENCLKNICFGFGVLSKRTSAESFSLFIVKSAFRPAQRRFHTNKMKLRNSIFDSKNEKVKIAESAPASGAQTRRKPWTLHIL